MHCFQTLLFNSNLRHYEKVAFLLVSHAIGGIIHVQICLSHFSRDVFEGRPESNKWVDMQLAGTMVGVKLCSLTPCLKWLGFNA